MSERLIFEVHEGLPRQGVGRDVYTRRAYEMLPQLDAPRILDIGCGCGAPTLELARSSGGQVTALDVHQPFLDELARRAVSAGLADRINVVQGSMLSMGFPDESFDLLWSEGSIFIVGFDQGLRQWRRLIRPDGFLVVHDVAWLRPGPPVEGPFPTTSPQSRHSATRSSAISRCPKTPGGSSTTTPSKSAFASCAPGMPTTTRR